MHPKRIVSLVPSQTELLYYLGLNDEVIGITKFCVHPDQWFRTKQRIGGTKQLHIDAIRQLKPDLIIANKEENVKEQVDELAKDFPVWISDVNDIPSAYEMIWKIGELCGKKEKAIELVNQIITALFAFHDLPGYNQIDNTAYLIWRDPYMTVGGDTFISDMMEVAGFNNMFKSSQRYPQVSVKELSNCELLLLSSEPYPFKQKHIDELQHSLPNTKIILVDGEMFSWYGSRMLLAIDYFKKLRSELS